MRPHLERAIWVFDSACALCDAGVRFTLRHEKSDSIRFVAIQSEEGLALAKTYGVDPSDPASFLFIENGQGLTQSDGVLALLRHLRGPVRLLGVGRVLPKGLRDALYRLLARNRIRLFGTVEQCDLPTEATRHRFTL